MSLLFQLSHDRVIRVDLHSLFGNHVIGHGEIFLENSQPRFQINPNQLYQMCKITTRFISSCTVFYIECSHSASTSFFYFSFPTFTLCSLNYSKSLCDFTPLSSYSKGFDPKQTMPRVIYWLSFCDWQSPSIPKSIQVFSQCMIFRWNDFSFRWLDSLFQSATLWVIQTREQCSSSNISQKQGKQLALHSVNTEKVLRKNVYRSSFRLGSEWGMMLVDILMISGGSEKFFGAYWACNGSSSRNQVGMYSFWQRSDLPWTSTNSSLREILSYLLKREYLDFLNFYSKTNLQAIKSSQEMRMLRKLDQPWYSSGCQFMSASSLPTSFLILFIKESYLDFLVFYLPVRYWQNQCSKGNNVQRRSNSFQYILAVMNLSSLSSFPMARLFCRLQF